MHTLCDTSLIYSSIALILLHLAELMTVGTPRPRWEQGQRIYYVKVCYETGSIKVTQDVCNQDQVTCIGSNVKRFHANAELEVVDHFVEGPWRTSTPLNSIGTS